MTDLKSCIYNHFFTRKKHFILGKPPLTIEQDKDYFYIHGEYKNDGPWFRIDHGVAHIYFANVDDIVNFIEKYKDKK